MVQEYSIMSSPAIIVNGESEGIIYVIPGEFFNGKPCLATHGFPKIPAAIQAVEFQPQNFARSPKETSNLAKFCRYAVPQL